MSAPTIAPSHDAQGIANLLDRFEAERSPICRVAGCDHAADGPGSGATGREVARAA